MLYKTGDLISFRYNSATATDRSPVCVVVNPRYNNLVHCVNIKNLPLREREMFLRIMNPEYQSVAGKFVENMPAFKSVMNKRQADPETLNEKLLYERYVAGFARRFNCYRTYKPQFMSSLIKIEYDKFKM
jgi:hypothetical protein